MIKAIFQLYNENKKIGEPLSKDFPDKSAMYAWWRSQDGHPWLSYDLVSHVEHIEPTCDKFLGPEFSLDWDNWKLAE